MTFRSGWHACDQRPFTTGSHAVSYVRRVNRLLAASITAVVLAVTACTSDSGRPRAESAGNAPAADECDPSLAEAFAAWGEAGFSGSVAISTDGELDCLAAYGLADNATDTPNTVDTVFSIGSVTKAFTAAAILDLVDHQKLSLDARAGELLEGLAGPAAEATIRQLLLHTSGLSGSHGEDYVPLERAAAIASLGELDLAFEPGSDFLYSNAGYTLLALIVEEAAGTSYRDYVMSRLLNLRAGEVAAGFWNGEPAAPEPRAVGYLEDGSPGEGDDFAGPHWAIEGSGGLAMTMGELARWADALFASRVLSPEATERLGTLSFDHGDDTSEAPGWVAFDPSLYGEPAYTAAGGGGTGHNVVVAALPGSRRVIAIASNTADVTAEDLFGAVGPALVAGTALPQPKNQGDAVDPAEIEAVAGTYVLDTAGSLVVRARGDRLAITATGADAVRALFPLPDGYTADGVAAHEQDVRSLLNGETGEGRKERASIESSLGPLDAIQLQGTIVRDNELRTYVSVTSGEETLLLWYALDDEGGIGAAEAGSRPPTLVLVSSGDGRYQPDDPTGATPDPTVIFGERRMSLHGPAGTVTARRVG